MKVSPRGRRIEGSVGERELRTLFIPTRRRTNATGEHGAVVPFPDAVDLLLRCVVCSVEVRPAEVRYEWSPVHGGSVNTGVRRESRVVGELASGRWRRGVRGSTLHLDTPRTEEDRSGRIRRGRNRRLPVLQGLGSMWSLRGHRREISAASDPQEDTVQSVQGLGRVPALSWRRHERELASVRSRSLSLVATKRPHRNGAE